MLIQRTETPTGGENRTRREEIVSLFREEHDVEPEYYWDASGSEGWPWERKPSVCTWDVQVEAARAVMIPFEQLDSQAAGEQAGGDDHRLFAEQRRFQRRPVEAADAPAHRRTWRGDGS